MLTFQELIGCGSMLRLVLWSIGAAIGTGFVLAVGIEKIPIYISVFSLVCAVVLGLFDSASINRMLSAAYNRGLSITEFSQLSSEASKLATANIVRDSLASLSLIALFVFLRNWDNSTFHDGDRYVFASAIIIIGYRALLIFRVYWGWFGCNDLEAIEFLEWLQKKWRNGHDDFSGTALERLRSQELTPSTSQQEA